MGCCTYFPFQDFNIQKDIAQIQEALVYQQDIPAVSQVSLRMLGRARRVAIVTRREMNATADPMYKGKLQSACAELESGLSFLADIYSYSMDILNFYHGNEPFIFF